MSSTRTISTGIPLAFILAALVALGGCGKKNQEGSGTQANQQAQTAQTQQTPAAQPPATPPAEAPPETPPPEPAKAEAPARHAERQAMRAPAQPTPTTRMVTVPAGTAMVADLNDKLTTENQTAGTTFTSKVDQPITQEGVVVVPAGSEVTGQIAFVSRAGRIRGKAQMTLQFTQLKTPDGQVYKLYSQPLALEGKSGATGDVEKVVGGAVGGAILGGILGGKSGIAKGAAVGGGAGGVWAVATRGPDIVLDPGTKLNVTLARAVEIPITVPAGGNP